MNDSSADVGSFLKFTQHLSDEARLDLTRLAKRHSLAKSEYAFRAGGPADSVCVVEYGHLKVFEPVPDGRDVLMFIREPGEILGLRGTLQRDGKGVRTYSGKP